MGFPTGYTQVLFPKLFIHLLSLLGLIRTLISATLTHMGLQDFLQQEHFSNHDNPSILYPPLSATLIRDLLPVVKFEQVCGESPQSCAVCLYQVEQGEEIRWLSNCKHIFHMGCLDRWMDHDHKTCPLCRTNFVPFGLQDVFNQRLWDACGITDDYYNAEFNSVSAF